MRIPGQSSERQRAVTVEVMLQLCTTTGKATRESNEANVKRKRHTHRRKQTKRLPEPEREELAEPNACPRSAQAAEAHSTNPPDTG